ncbi:MAG TPA: hypothetical protein VGJ74_17120 [Burkholderiales bacterium]
MGGIASVAILILAGWAALTPQPMAWIYILVVAAFELWLARRIAALANDPVAAGAPPYRFTEDEARLVRRYRFYFTYPVIARDASSVLAAVGLSGLVLALWLTYKQAFLPALIVGANLFAVSRLTRLLAPLMVLRMAASRGDRDALLLLAAHDPAWAKIRAGNE